MLNRTNRTLSANLIGLNLGTRSFVDKTNANNGNPTSQILHAHHRAMRDGVMRMVDPSIRSISRIDRPGIPCSSVGSSWPVWSAAKVQPPVAGSEHARSDVPEAKRFPKPGKPASKVVSKRFDRLSERLFERYYDQSTPEAYQGFRQGFRAESRFAIGRATATRQQLAAAIAAARG